MFFDAVLRELLLNLTDINYIRQFIADKHVVTAESVSFLLRFAVDSSPLVLELLLDHVCGRFITPEVGKPALDHAITVVDYKCVVLLLSRLGLEDYTPMQSPIKVASIQMRHRNYHVDHPRIISLLVAAGARPSDIERPQLPDGQDCLFTTAGQTPCVDSTCIRLRAALEPEAIARAQLDLFRHRMTQVCIALQSADLPALLTILIIDELIDNSIRMWAKWEIVTATKHYHQRRGIEG